MQGIGVGVAIAILLGSSWLILTKGGWIPLIPPTLAVFFSVGSLIVINLGKMKTYPATPK
jgi:adenylate cyclase